MAKREELDKRKSRYNRYFSPEFRKKKVKEIEQNLATVSEISREYDVSTTAVYKWLHKYSKHYKKGVKQVIEPMSDTKKIERLRQKIKELEQLVGQKEVELDFKEKMIELVEREYGIDIKKKFGSGQLSGSGDTGKNTDGR